jgi:FAR-17a/AIG1-like protein
VLRLVRFFFGLLTLIAVGRQLAVHAASGAALLNFFSYYTILSNLLAGSVLLWSAASAADANRSIDTLRFISAVNMAMVGIVFSLLLRNTDVGSLLPWVNIVHHYLLPCAVVLDFILMPPRTRLWARELGLSLAFPLCYLIYTLFRGSATGWYPYPFLNPQAAGALGVAIYVICITFAFGIVGFALLRVSRWAPLMLDRIQSD